MPRTNVQFTNTFINGDIKKDLSAKLYEAGFLHDCADACINAGKKDNNVSTTLEYLQVE